MSLPNCTTVNDITEVWTLPNFQQFINIRGNRGFYNRPPQPVSSLSSAFHVFYLEKHSTNQAEEPLQAKANLSVNEVTSELILVISLHDRQPPPSWAVTVKFSSISFVNTIGRVDETHPNHYGSNAVYEETDLRTWNCTAPLFHTRWGERIYNSCNNSLTIRFSLSCRITKQPTTGSGHLLAEKDLQLCGIEALSDFEALMKNAVLADITITTTKGEIRSFQCHKAILAARSPVLSAMFETTMKETQENLVTVEDISPETMEHFLSFLYCGRFQNETWVRHLPHLTYAADKYCVSSLKQFCDSNIIRSVTCENALAIADLAQRHKLCKAVVDIREFIAQNAGKLNLDLASAIQALSNCE